MAIEAARLFVGVDADTSQAEGKLGKFSSGLGSIIGGAAKAATVALAGIGIAAGGMSIAGIKAASDFEESLNKVNVVFGDAADGVRAFADNAAQSFGISESSALAATGTFGNLFTSMGLGQKEAADLSTNVLGLAADLGSFNNLGTEEVLEKIRAGLVGETEPLKSLGINLNAAAIEARAMAMGLADAEGNLSPAAKAQAAYALIVEQSTNAQGDFARTKDGMANSIKVIRASFADLTAQIGQRLLPAVTPLIVAFAARMPAAIDLTMQIVDRIADTLRGPLTTAFTLARDGLLTFIQALQGNWTDDSRIHPLHRAIGLIGSVIRDQVIPAVMGLASWFTGTALPAIQTFATLAAGFVTGTLIPAFLQIASAVLPVLQQFADWFTGVALPAIQNFATAAVGFITGSLIPAFQSFWEAIKPGLEALVGFLDGNLRAVFVGVGAIIVAGFTAWAISAAAAAVATIAALAPIIVTLAAIGAAAALLYAAWDTNFLGIQDITKRVIDWLSANVPPVFDAIWSAIRTGLSAVMTAWNAAWPVIRSVVETVMPIVAQVVTTYIGILKAEIELALGVVQTVWNTVFPAIQSVVETVFPIIAEAARIGMSALQLAVETGVNAAKWAFDNVFVPIQGVVSDVFGTISGIVETVWGPAVSAITAGVDTAKGYFDSTFVPIQGVVSDVFSTISDLIGSLWLGASGGVQMVVSGVATIYGVFEGAYEKMYGFASSMFQGLKDGLAGIVEFVGGVVDGIIDAYNQIPAFLRPGSPSKWATEMGKSLTDGLVAGMQSSMPELQRTVDGINATLATVGVDRSAELNDPRNYMTRATYLLMKLEQQIKRTNDAAIQAAKEDIAKQWKAGILTLEQAEAALAKVGKALDSVASSTGKAAKTVTNHVQSMATAIATAAYNISVGFMTVEDVLARLKEAAALNPENIESIFASNIEAMVKTLQQAIFAGNQSQIDRTRGMLAEMLKLADSMGFDLGDELGTEVLAGLRNALGGTVTAGAVNVVRSTVPLSPAATVPHVASGGGVHDTTVTRQAPAIDYARLAAEIVAATERGTARGSEAGVRKALTGAL